MDVSPLSDRRVAEFMVFAGMTDETVKRSFRMPWEALPKGVLSRSQLTIRDPTPDTPACREIIATLEG